MSCFNHKPAVEVSELITKQLADVYKTSQENVYNLGGVAKVNYARYSKRGFLRIMQTPLAIIIDLCHDTHLRLIKNRILVSLHQSVELFTHLCRYLNKKGS